MTPTIQWDSNKFLPPDNGGRIFLGRDARGEFLLFRCVDVSPSVIHDFQSTLDVMGFGKVFKFRIHHGKLQVGRRNLKTWTLVDGEKRMALRGRN